MFSKHQSIRMRTITNFAVLALGLSMGGQAYAALNAYLTLEGETQGVIEGSSDVAPHEGKIVVNGYHHKNGEGPAWQECKVGESSHEPMMIIKKRDKSTPLLYNAYSMGESFSTFRLEFYEPSSTGAESHTFTIELINARIVGIDQDMRNNVNPENMMYPVQEKVYFVYDAIVRTFEDGAVASMDDWKTTCGK